MSSRFSLTLLNWPSLWKKWNWSQNSLLGLSRHVLLGLAVSTAASSLQSHPHPSHNRSVYEVRLGGMLYKHTALCLSRFSLSSNKLWPARFCFWTPPGNPLGSQAQATDESERLPWVNREGWSILVTGLPSIGLLSRGHPAPRFLSLLIVFFFIKWDVLEWEWAHGLIKKYIDERCSREIACSPPCWVLPGVDFY